MQSYSIFKTYLIISIFSSFTLNIQAQNIIPRIDKNYLLSCDGMSISGDKSIIANYCVSGKIESTNLETQKVVYNLDLQSNILSVTFTNDNNLIVVHEGGFPFDINSNSKKLLISHIELGGCNHQSSNPICYQTKLKVPNDRSPKVLSSIDNKYLQINNQLYDIEKKQFIANIPTITFKNSAPTIDGSSYLLTSPRSNKMVKIDTLLISYTINSFAYSTDEKYVAIASGEDSGFWSTTGEMIEMGRGSVILYDVVNQKIVYQTDMKNNQPIRNVIDVQWTDEKTYVITDSKANVLSFGLERPYSIKSIVKPNTFPTPLATDPNFRYILFSNYFTHILSTQDNTLVQPIDSLNHSYLQVNENGTFAAAPFGGYAGSEDDRERFGQNNRIIKTYNPYGDVSKMHLSQDGGLLIKQRTEKANNSYYNHPVYVQENDRLKDKYGKIIGARINDIDYYDLNLELTFDSLALEETQIVTLDDTKNGIMSQFQYTNRSITDFDISFDQRYLALKNNYYDNAANDPYTPLQQYHLFDREEHTFISTILDKEILLQKFDKKSDLALTLLADGSYVIWHKTPNNIIYSDQDIVTWVGSSNISEEITVTESSSIVFNNKQNQLLIDNHILIDYDLQKVKIIKEQPIVGVSGSGKYFVTKDDSFSAGNAYTTSVSGNDIHIGKWGDDFDTFLDFSVRTEFNIDENRQLVFFHKDKDIALVNTGEGIAQIYDLQSKDLLITIKLLISDDWLAYTPDGIFDGSPEGRSHLYYTEGKEVILLDQLKSKYWVPGLIDKIINKPYMLADVEPIKTFPLFPTATLSLQESTGTIQVNLKERNGGIGKVALYINNKEVDPNINPNHTATCSVKLIDYQKHLYENNVNLIEIVTYNKEGWLQSRPTPYYVHTKLQGAKDGTAASNQFTESSAEGRTSSTGKPALFGLFVGTSTYDDPFLKLAYADNDAKALREGMIAVSQDMYDQRRSKLQLLTSDASFGTDFPSKRNIMKALDDIASEAKPDDIIFLFLSGHGITIDDDFYYLTHTAKDITNQPVASRAGMTLSALEINTALRNIASNKQVLILDACHSGGIASILEGSTKSAASSQQKALEFLEDKMGVYILASSEADQKSFETEKLQQGLLTFSLLLGLSGEAMVDSVINILDLLTYSTKKSEEIGKLMSKVQRPVLGVGRGGSSFPIGFPSDQIKVASLDRPKITSSKLNQFPQGYDPLYMSESITESLSKKGGINTSSKYLYVSTNGPDTYQLTGTYSIEGDNIIVRAYVIKANQVVAGPLERTEPIGKLKKLELLLTNDFFKAIDQLQE